MSEQNIDLSQDTGTPQPQPDYTPANTTEDAILGRHINMAIEAQDGPKNANEAAATPAVTPGTNPQQSAAQGKQDGSGTGKPIGTDSAAQQQQAAGHFESTLCRDGAADVARVANAAAFLDVLPDRVQLDAQSLDIGFGQVREFRYVSDCHIDLLPVTYASVTYSTVGC